MGVVINPLGPPFDFVGGAGGGGTTTLISNVKFSAGTLSQTRTDITFANSNGVSFGLNTNGVITATVSTNYAGTGFTTTTTTGTAIVGTNTTNGLSLGVPAFLTTAMASDAVTLSNIRVSAGTTSNLLSRITFADGSGVTWGLNASTLTASVKTDYLTTQTSQSAIKGFGASNTGNTAGNTGLSTGIDWVIAGSNNITISESTAGGGPNTIWVSGPTTAAQSSQSAIKAFGATNTGNTAGNTGVSTGIDWVIAGTNNITVSESTVAGGPNTLWLSAPNAGGGGAVTFSAGTSSGSLNSVVFSDASGVTWGLSGSTITASVKTDYLTNINVSAGTTSNNLSKITFADSNGVSFGINASTITASVAAEGTLSFFSLIVPFSTSSNSVGNNSLVLNPLAVQENVSFSKVLNPVSVSYSTAASSHTLQLTVALSVALYTRNGSTLSRASSGATNWQMTVSSNDLTASVSGIRYLSVPLNVSATPGDYWVGCISSTSSNRQAGGTNSFAFSNFLDVGQIPSTGGQGLFSAAVNSTFQYQLGKGVYSATTTGFPSGIQISEIAGNSSAGAFRFPLLYAANFTA